MCKVSTISTNQPLNLKFKKLFTRYLFSFKIICFPISKIHILQSSHLSMFLAQKNFNSIKEEKIDTLYPLSEFLNYVNFYIILKCINAYKINFFSLRLVLKEIFIHFCTVQCTAMTKNIILLLYPFLDFCVCCRTFSVFIYSASFGS